MKRTYSKTLVFILILSFLFLLSPTSALAKENVTIPINEEITSVSLGGSHSAAINKNGILYSWGDNSFGQLGDGTTTESQEP